MPQTQQCPACHGSGVVTCSACNGSGGHSETRVEYDWENNPSYREEWISCYSCSGGMASCGQCGGNGHIQK